MKHQSDKYLGTNDGPVLLFLRYLEQGKRCFYTNDILVFGVNASVEHVLPKSLYPGKSHDICNLVWTTVYVNRAKNDLHIQEFLRMCEAVTRNSQKIREFTTTYENANSDI